MFKRFSIGAAALAVLLATSVNAQVHGTRCKVTSEAFSNLSEGMTHDQVVSVLGCDGVVMSSSKMSGHEIIMMAWDGRGSLGANMNVMFENGRMIMKSQFGLR